MPAPAEPVLASHIWAASQGRREYGHLENTLFTGCCSFDDALGSSLRCQDPSLCCISGHDTVVADVSQALLISQLVTSASSTVTIIDARGSLDLLSLFTTLKSRLVSQSRSQPLGDGERVHELATSLLDRIKIMRVFDYEGALEAIHEVRSELETPSRTADEAACRSRSRPGLPRSTVPDSQADHADEIPIPAPAPQSSDPTRSRRPPQTEPAVHRPPLLILDDLPSLIQPITSKNYTQGQALLSTLLRSLRHLHTNHGITTILQNGVTGLPHRRSAPPRSVNDPGLGPGLDPAESAEHQSPSIFASARLRPALGPVLAESLDLLLMVHPVPRAPGDARALIAREAAGVSWRDGRCRGRGQGLEGEVGFVNVVEVLFDRCGERTGRFGAFEVGVDGVLRDAFR